MLLAISGSTKPSLQHPSSCGDFKRPTWAKWDLERLFQEIFFLCATETQPSDSVTRRFKEKKLDGSVWAGRITLQALLGQFTSMNWANSLKQAVVKQRKSSEGNFVAWMDSNFCVLSSAVVGYRNVWIQECLGQSIPLKTHSLPVQLVFKSREVSKVTFSVFDVFFTLNSKPQVPAPGVNTVFSHFAAFPGQQNLKLYHWLSPRSSSYFTATQILHSVRTKKCFVIRARAEDRHWRHRTEVLVTPTRVTVSEDKPQTAESDVTQQKKKRSTHVPSARSLPVLYWHSSCWDFRMCI